MCSTYWRRFSTRLAAFTMSGPEHRKQAHIDGDRQAGIVYPCQLPYDGSWPDCHIASLHCLGTGCAYQLTLLKWMRAAQPLVDQARLTDQARGRGQRDPGGGGGGGGDASVKGGKRQKANGKPWCDNCGINTAVPGVTGLDATVSYQGLPSAFWRLFPLTEALPHTHPPPPPPPRSL